MTLEEELERLCLAYQKEADKGTFQFTPFTASCLFLNRVKKELRMGELSRDTVFDFVARLRAAVSLFQTALEKASKSASPSSHWRQEEHKKRVFHVLAHEVQEIIALLEQGKKKPPSSPRRRRSLHKQKWTRS